MRRALGCRWVQPDRTTLPACCCSRRRACSASRIGRRLFHAAHARHCGRGHRAFAHGLAHALYAGHGGRNRAEEQAKLLHLLRVSGVETAARPRRIIPRQKGEFFHEKNVLFRAAHAASPRADDVSHRRGLRLAALAVAGADRAAFADASAAAARLRCCSRCWTACPACARWPIRCCLPSSAALRFQPSRTV